MIIGISGRARSGKDTVAQIIRQYLPKYQTYDLSRPGKVALRAMFPWWSEGHTDGNLKDVIDPILGVTPRHCMQTLLTDWAQIKIRQDIWTVCAEQNLKADKNVVVPGVRFSHQVDWIHDKKGIMIHVVRDLKDNSLYNHISENSMEPFLDEDDHVVENNETISALSAKIWSILVSTGLLKKS